MTEPIIAMALTASASLIVTGDIEQVTSHEGANEPANAAATVRKTENCGFGFGFGARNDPPVEGAPHKAPRTVCGSRSRRLIGRGVNAGRNI